MSSGAYGQSPSGYRLPADAHTGTVRLQVSDLERSLGFYEGLLRLHVISRDAAGAQLGAANSERPLLELRAGTKTRASRSGRLGLYHFAMLLPDRPALGSLLAHLLAEGLHPGAADHLVSEALYLQDPDDLGIELYCDRPRSEWKKRGREIAMATDPLDGAGLIGAANGVAWNGMPDGTVIGHVHLHVRDLEIARRFYHDALGFDIIVSTYPGALFMSAGGYHHHLGVNTWAGAHARPPAPDEPQLLSWDLVLPTANDVAAAALSLTRAGYAVTPEEVGGSMAYDPWQIPVRLVTSTAGLSQASGNSA